MRTFGEMYAEILDELYGEAEVCGMSYESSRALRELDPTAYRCGFSDWLDSLECEGCGGSNFDVSQEDEYRALCDDCENRDRMHAEHADAIAEIVERYNAAEDDSPVQDTAVAEYEQLTGLKWTEYPPEGV